MEESPITRAGATTIPAQATTERRPWTARLLAHLELDPQLARFALWVFALSRLGFVVLTYVTLAVVHVPLTPGSLVNVWYRRDALAFGQLAANGYQLGPNAGLAAFFPLQPLMMRLIAPLLGGNLGAAGLLVSNLSFAVALLGVAALAARDADAATARRTMLYLTVFPTALFFFAGYSESLFLALTVWAFVCMRRGWWWQAGLLGLFACLTRQAGVFLVLPFIWEYGTRIGWQLRHLRPSALAIVLIPLGPLLFMAWLWHAVGNPLALVSAQRFWGRGFAFPWSTLHQALRALPHQGDVVLTFRGSIDLGAIVLMGGLLLYGLRRMPVGDLAYSAALLLLPLFSPSVWWPLLSNGRFMLVVFPCFILLAREGRRPWLNVLIITVFGILLLVMAQYFVRGNPQIL